MEMLQHQGCPPQTAHSCCSFGSSTSMMADAKSSSTKLLSEFYREMLCAAWGRKQKADDTDRRRICAME